MGSTGYQKIFRILSKLYIIDDRKPREEPRNAEETGAREPRSGAI